MQAKTLRLSTWGSSGPWRAHCVSPTLCQPHTVSALHCVSPTLCQPYTVSALHCQRRAQPRQRQPRGAPQRAGLDQRPSKALGQVSRQLHPPTPPAPALAHSLTQMKMELQNRELFASAQGTDAPPMVTFRDVNPFKLWVGSAGLG